MNVQKGDKLRLIQPIYIQPFVIGAVGDECVVKDIVNGDAILIGEKFQVVCAVRNLPVVFEKVASPISVTAEQVQEIMNHSTVTVQTLHGKCTIVTCKLPNGFVIVESSACVDPANYDEKMGTEICINRIKDKVWELEGYRLQANLYEMRTSATNESMLVQ